MIDFKVDFVSKLGGDNFHRLYSSLESRVGMHKAIADVAVETTAEYLRGIAPARHRTATDLGATPTGALSKAAERVTGSATEKAATVHVVGSFFARVFRDVTITPKESRALTIPMHAAAYGKRVGELKLQGWVFFMPKTKDGKGKRRPILWAENPNGEILPMYVLATSVNQKQDRRLLPSDEAYLAAAEKGARNYLDQMPTT